MLTRRTLIAAAPLAACPLFPPSALAAGDFSAFVAGVKADAHRAGISQATLDRAFAGIQPNAKVIELDQHQPEFTLTWQQYKTRIVSDARIARGRGLYAQNRVLLTAISQQYGVPAGVMMGIWGLESNYGESSGGFNVIEALATLSWEGRRAAFFRGELMDALKILQHGDVPPERLIGSYAGAMGQPQFMPDSYLKYAVDYLGDGHRDIWGRVSDVFASIANYISGSGWNASLPWGAPAQLPQGFDAAQAGRDHPRSVAEWARMGVRPAGRGLPGTALAAVILPGGPGDDAYLACQPNFRAIRRYNPSDFYCLSVGLIGDGVTA